MDDVLPETEITPRISKRFTLDPLSVAGVIIGIGQSIYTAYADGTDNRFVQRNHGGSENGWRSFQHYHGKSVDYIIYALTMFHYVLPMNL